MATPSPHSSGNQPGNILHDQFDPTTRSVILPEHYPLLRGRHIWLEPAREEHREALREVARDGRIWEGTRTLLMNDTFDQQFDQYYDTALAEVSGGGQSFTVRTTGDDLIIGMTRINDVNPKMRTLHIGWTWYLPSLWGKVHNKECKLLLLQYAFETLGYNRAEFRVAHQNIRSQKAMEKIGAVREGVMRKAGIRPDGEIRHVVIYSVIDEEWPATKVHLQALVEKLG